MVDLVLTGTHQRAIDDKGRFLLPKKLRDGLDNALFLTPGTDRCLELHSGRSLQELAQRTRLSAAGSRQIKSFSRLFYAQAEQCEIDGLGRIRMPRHLIDYALIKKEIVILGVGSNWEIWDAENWQTYLQSNAAAFDRMSQATFDAIPVSSQPRSDQIRLNQAVEDKVDGEFASPPTRPEELHRPAAPR